MKIFRKSFSAIIISLVCFVFSSTLYALPSTAIQDLDQKYNSQTSPVHLEGDSLLFLVKSKAKSVSLTGTFYETLSRIEGTDYWQFKTPIKDGETAVIRYDFSADGDNDVLFGPSANSLVKSGRFYSWRGEKAESVHKVSKNLKGQIISHAFESPSLGAKRKVKVYLPPHYSLEQEYPVFYFTDGEELESYAYIFEALLDKALVREAILVGANAGGYLGDRSQGYDIAKDMRQVEYLANFALLAPEADATRFDAHKKFFVEELSAFAEEKYNASNKASERFYVGSSNGGSYGVTLSYQVPEHFSKVILYSIGWSLAWDGIEQVNNLPEYYISYGTLDGFSTVNEQFLSILSEKGKAVTVTKKVRGHDLDYWVEEFYYAAQWALSE